METYSKCDNIGERVKTGSAIKNSSFLIKIKYNQHSTIQGSVQWLEKKETVFFRSLMELFLLLKEAVSNNDDYRTWDGEEGKLSEVNKSNIIQS